MMSRVESVFLLLLPHLIQPIRVVGYGDFACVLCRPRRTGTNLSRNKRNILQPFVAVGGCKLFVILFCGLQSLGLLSAQWVRLWLLLLLVGFGGKDGVEEEDSDPRRRLWREGEDNQHFIKHLDRSSHFFTPSSSSSLVSRSVRRRLWGFRNWIRTGGN